MRPGLVVVCLIAFGVSAFGQTANGTITGTVTDPTGAVVAGASVQAKNTETGLTYPVMTTDTGKWRSGGMAARCPRPARVAP